MGPEDRDSLAESNRQCDYCGGSGTVYPECTCYEVIGGGHQMGCCFYGLNREEIREYSNTEYDCPNCKPKSIPLEIRDD